MFSLRLKINSIQALLLQGIKKLLCAVALAAKKSFFLENAKSVFLFFLLIVENFDLQLLFASHFDVGDFFNFRVESQFLYRLFGVLLQRLALCTAGSQYLY